MDFRFFFLSLVNAAVVSQPNPIEWPEIEKYFFENFAFNEGTKRILEDQVFGPSLLLSSLYCAVYLQK